MTIRGARGIIVPIVTPLNEQGVIDAIGTRKVLDHVIENGVAGVFALGSTGEFSSLTYQQKVDFIRLVAKENNKRVLLYVGITSPCRQETNDLMREAQACGADAVVASPPYYFPFSTQSDLAGYFEELADASPLPLMLYNNTGYGKASPLLPPTVARLAKHPKIIGIKDISGFVDMLAMVAATAGDSFGVFAGNDFQMAAAACFGAHGGVNSLANVAPRFYVEAYKLAAVRDLQALGDVTISGSPMAKLLAVHDLYKVGPNAISAIKGALSLLGLCGTAVAKPLQPVEPQDLEDARAVLAKVGLL